MQVELRCSYNGIKCTMENREADEVEVVDTDGLPYLWLVFAVLCYVILLTP